MNIVLRLRAFFNNALAFVKEKRIWLIPVCVLAGVAISAAVALYAVPKEYVSTETVAIMNNVHGREHELEALSASHHLAELYAVSALHDTAARQTVQQCGLDMTAKQLLSRLSAERIDHTVVVNITLRLHQRDDVQDVLAVYTDNLNTLLKAALAIDNVYILRAPTAPVADFHLGIATLLGALIGLAIGAAICIIYAATSRLIFNQGALEGFGVALIAAIPSFEREGGSRRGKTGLKGEARYGRQ